MGIPPRAESSSPTARSSSATRCWIATFRDFSRPAPIAMNAQRLSDDLLNPESRIERRKRILKDNLHITAQLSHLAMAGAQ